MKILVINTGSSSIKYHLYEMDDESELAAGQLVRIGDAHSQGEARLCWSDAAGNMQCSRHPEHFADHRVALEYLFEHMEENGIPASAFSAVGHRVVHGGEIFHSATLIDDSVIEAIRDLGPLAPLHNPVNLLGIELIHQHWPSLPQFAIFDTAFHRDLPECAYHYALPEHLPTAHPIRRYGFHGISYAYVSSEAASFLNRPLEQLRLIVLHLGNGASMAAINQGKCIDTTMGLTPLEGLVMGSRCGDIDASVIFYLQKELGYSSDEVEDILNHKSGLTGLCGHGDMQQIHADADKGNAEAHAAIEIFCYRIRKYIGAFLAALGGVDALVFTGGIGENDDRIRQQIIEPITFLGFALDNDKNQMRSNQNRAIHSTVDSLPVLVIPTNEELEIAKQVASFPD